MAKKRLPSGGLPLGNLHLPACSAAASVPRARWMAEQGVGKGAESWGRLLPPLAHRRPNLVICPSFGPKIHGNPELAMAARERARETGSSEATRVAGHASLPIRESPARHSRLQVGTLRALPRSCAPLASARQHWQGTSSWAPKRVASPANHSFNLIRGRVSRWRGVGGVRFVRPVCLWCHLRRQAALALQSHRFFTQHRASFLRHAHSLPVPRDGRVLPRVVLAGFLRASAASRHSQRGFKCWLASQGALCRRGTLGERGCSHAQHRAGPAPLLRRPLSPEPQPHLPKES
jgi:hypothetical protein